MFFEQVCVNSPGDDFAVRAQGIREAVARGRRDFERYVDELAELEIVFGASLVVVEGGDKAFRPPSRDFFGRG